MDRSQSIMSQGGTPSQRFRSQIQSGSLQHLQRLAAKLTDIRGPDPSTRQTSLQLATLYGRLDVVEWLLLDEGHEDTEISRDTLGETCCHIAAAYGHVAILELYISQYPFVMDWVNSRGATPLHIAAMKGELEAAQFLVESGSDIDAPDLQGNTPLHYASSYDKVLVAKLLIERRCQYGQRNNEGFTASDYSYSFACQKSIEDYAELLKKSSRPRKASKPSFRVPRSVRLDTSTSTPNSAPATPQLPSTPDGTQIQDAYGLGLGYPSSPSQPVSAPLSPSGSLQAMNNSGLLATPPTSSHGGNGNTRTTPSSPLSTFRQHLGRSESATSNLGGQGQGDGSPIQESIRKIGMRDMDAIDAFKGIRPLKMERSDSAGSAIMGPPPLPPLAKTKNKRSDSVLSDETGGSRTRSMSNLSSSSSHEPRSRSGSNHFPPPLPLNLALPSKDPSQQQQHSPPPPTPPSATTKPTSIKSGVMSKSNSSVGNAGSGQEDKEKERTRSGSNESNAHHRGKMARAFGLGKKS